MTLRLPLLLLSVISLPFSAPTAAAAGEAGKGITLRLLACEVSQEPAKVFLETKDSKSDVFDLPSSAPSEPMALSARSAELKAPDNNVPLCSITLPAEGKSFAVLLAPEKPAGFAPFVVRLDDDSFKPGDYFFVNASGKTIALKLGGTELILEAGNAAKSRPSEPLRNSFYNVTMSTRGESGDRPIASTRWPLEHPNRTYIIFLTNARGKTTYRAVDEPLEAAAGGNKR